MERERRIAFPTIGNGNGNEELHFQLLGTGLRMKKTFPTYGNGNGRLVFTGMVGNGNSRSPLVWGRITSPH